MPWISAGASILGGLFGSSSSKKAASAQAAATDRATQLEKYIYAIDAGNLGRNKLLELLGLGGTPGGATNLSRDAVRQNLLSKYTTAGTPGEPIYGPKIGDDSPQITGYSGTGPTVDEAGLQAAIDAEMARSGGANSLSADYGSLLRNFTGADLENEPGYQFGLAEGNKGLDRKAAAAGGYFSGAALKAASRFNQDYAGTKYNDAFNRDSANKTNTYNRLTGLTGAGQVSANQVGAAGTNYANSTGNLLTSNANAQGAAGMQQADYWGDALTAGANALTRYNAQNRVSVARRDE